MYPSAGGPGARVLVPFYLPDDEYAGAGQNQVGDDHPVPNKRRGGDPDPGGLPDGDRTFLQEDEQLGLLHAHT